MIRFFLPIASVAVVLCSETLPGIAADGDKPSLKTVLAARILPEGLSTTEVQQFVTGKILPMPAVKTAAEWEAYAEARRAETLARVVFRGEAEEWRKIPTKVEWLDTIEGGPGYSIRKLRYEAVPGMWIPALLYVPAKLEGKVPVCLNVNGHDAKGKAADYKQLRCINQAKRGMLALNLEWVNMGQLRGADFEHYKMNQLDLCGTSGLAPFYLSMSRGLDILLSLEHADPTRVAVAGLSGGGWQTIFISALDTRVTLSNPVAGYSSFFTRLEKVSDLGDSEQTPVDLGITADYMQLTAIRAPKPTLLTFNAADNCCFKASHALPPLMDGCGPIYKLYGKEAALRSHVNEDPGDHNFGLDNRQQLYRMLGDFFYPGRKDYDWKEIASDSEVKTSEGLMVEVPQPNAGFNTLAKRVAEKLPREPALPTTKEEAEKWATARRAALAEVVRTKPYAVEQSIAEADSAKDVEGTTVSLSRLRLSGGWTVPATELVRDASEGTALVIADAGRASQSAEAAALLDRKLRVVAIDPYGIGETRTARHDVLWGLMISTVGERPLGVQARQIGAIARHLKKEHGKPVTVVSNGPRTSLMALAASALEPDSIAGVEAKESFGSLKEVIEKGLAVTAGTEMFCFGLLEQFDVAQLTALSAPRRVRFIDPSDRVKAEMMPLKSCYGVHGINYDPLGE